MKVCTIGVACLLGGALGVQKADMHAEPYPGVQTDRRSYIIRTSSLERPCICSVLGILTPNLFCLVCRDAVSNRANGLNNLNAGRVYILVDDVDLIAYMVRMN